MSKTFIEWLTFYKTQPKIKLIPIKEKEFRCTSCGTTDLNKRSNMDKSLCDFCWHCTMASTFSV